MIPIPAAKPSKTLMLSGPTDPVPEVRRCKCGRELVYIGRVEHRMNDGTVMGVTGGRWPAECPACQEKRRLQEVREIRLQRRNELWKAIKAVLPPLFHRAHLRDLSRKLRRAIMDHKVHEGLYCWGPVGCGKSHAAAAVIRSILCHDVRVSDSGWVESPAGRVKRVTFADLCLEVRATFNGRGGSEDSVLHQYRRCEHLFIEDLSTTGGGESEFALRVLLGILDWRVENMKPTYITSNKKPSEIGKAFDGRVESRIVGACKVVALAGQDKRRRTC